MLVYSLGMTTEEAHEMNKSELLAMCNKHLKAFQHQLLETHHWKGAYQVMEKNFEDCQVVIHRYEKEIERLTHNVV